MKDRLTFEVIYPQPPEAVWRALTDPAALKQWLLPAEFQAKIGFRFRLDGEKAITGEVLEAETNRKLVYTWDDGEAGSPSLVEWRLSPADGGTRLRLAHTAAESEDSYVLIEADMNWRATLRGALPGLLRQPVPIVYEADDGEDESNPKRRAGFRQEAPICS